MDSTQEKSSRRNPRLDLLRIVFALLVLLAHAPELTDGNNSRELLARSTHSGFTFGVLGVDGFFLLSGFLIVQSWEHNPELLNFLKKRVLRIVPGYLVAAFLSILVVGLIAPGEPQFFRHIRPLALAVSLLRLSVPATPLVFPGMPFFLANGSLWSINYEFRCYILVAVFGMCGLIRRRLFCVFVAALFACVAFTPYLKASRPELIATYFVGACFYLFRERIRFRPVFALLAGFAMIALGLNARTIELGFVLFGGYLLFYFAQLPLKEAIAWKAFPDISYGIYLYGWPVESLWIWYHHGSPWITVLISVPACMALGWLSWECVERPMLKLKRRGLSPVPPA